MSLINHQVTCACCGRKLAAATSSLEPLIDPSVRYVAVHPNCHTFTHRPQRRAN
jgi:hypothetical protein